MKITFLSNCIIEWLLEIIRGIIATLSVIVFILTNSLYVYAFNVRCWGLTLLAMWLVYFLNDDYFYESYWLLDSSHWSLLSSPTQPLVWLKSLEPAVFTHLSRPHGQISLDSSLCTYYFIWSFQCSIKIRHQFVLLSQALWNSESSPFHTSQLWWL